MKIYIVTMSLKNGSQNHLLVSKDELNEILRKYDKNINIIKYGGIKYHKMVYVLPDEIDKITYYKLEDNKNGD